MFNREEHYLDDFLRKKLGSHTVEPAEGAWESISSKLGPPQGFAGLFRFYLNQFIIPVLTGLIMFSGIAISFSGSHRIQNDEGLSTSIIEHDNDTKATLPSGLASASPVQKESLTETQRNSLNSVNSLISGNSGNSEISLYSLNNDLDPLIDKHSALRVNPTTNEEAIDYASAQTLNNESDIVSASSGNENEEIIAKQQSGNASVAAAAMAIVAAPVEIDETKEDIIEQTSEAPPGDAPEQLFTANTSSETIGNNRTSIYSMPLRSFISLQYQPVREQNIYSEGYRKQISGHKSKEYLMRPTWSIGMYYVPEIYYSENLYGEKQLFAIDATMRYGFYDYFLESGFGISRVRNDNKYVVTYNDFLGTYNSLDSINFTPDGSGGVIPNYYWTETLVYDSLSKEEESSSRNYYTYLQIPLYIGYEYNYKRFSLSLKGGPLFSLMIHKKEAEVIFDEESKQVIAIDDKTPGRLRTNWQLLFYGGIRYKITNNWSVSLEPGIRMYLDQVYEKDNYTSKLPYSVNLRTGLLYTF